MNRRQRNEGNRKLYPMVEETITEYLRRETFNRVKFNQS